MARGTFAILGGAAALALAGVPARLAAAEAAPPEAGFFGLMAQTVGGLALVLLVMVGLYLVARRYLPKGLGGGPGLKVLARLPLGPRKQVVVVQVAGRALVLGVGADSVNLLATLDDPGQLTGAPPAPRERFAEALRNAQAGEDAHHDPS